MEYLLAFFWSTAPLAPTTKVKIHYINLFKNDVLMEKNIQIHYSNLFINDVLMKKNMNVQI